MTTALPAEFISTMRERLGDEAEELFTALDSEAVTSIRLNPAKPAEVWSGEAVG